MMLIGIVAFLAVVGAETWCGKNYMSTDPIVPPGGQFIVPAQSPSQLLAIRCGQAVRPYLPEDVLNSDKSFTSILVDTPVIHSFISGAFPLHGQLIQSTTAEVTVSVEGIKLTSGSVPLNSTKHPLHFSLSSLKPRQEAYNLTCSATVGSQRFETHSLFSFLPDPPPEIGSVTKMDMRTGALLARPANGKGGQYETVFPLGFYTDSDGYLLQNVSKVRELKEQGFNIIHPVPSFSNLTALEEVLDLMDELGMYLMYDMRGDYQNTTLVTAQVQSIQKRSSLLLWYTADEPDGFPTPFNATVVASNLIKSLDGGDGLGGAGYHPVSLVLNCENYEWTPYASGADILLQDTYMVGIDPVHSIVYGTECTRDYGDCGCDNCQGKYQDISTRMDEFRSRIFINGWELEKAVWTVPQAFGNQSFWPRNPTGAEFIVQAIVGVNHGALGIIPWVDPNTDDIKASASSLALALPELVSFIASPLASFRQVLTGDLVDIGLWTVGSETLLLAANTGSRATSVKLSSFGLGRTHVSELLNSGASVSADGTSIEMALAGAGAFIVRG
ncbi:hypothetical protein C8J56DRAFT_395738 [Mycena floridula]|nr:hypothetical protein C8J56DRAFT_395738 [Mycena floridula]